METTGHRIVVDESGSVEFVCEALAGSECRLGCVADCEDQHRADCDRSRKDTGGCGALPFLQSEEAFDTYIGATEIADWVSGPIETEWDGYYETWVWRFPAEQRELPGSRRQERVHFDLLGLTERNKSASFPFVGALGSGSAQQSIRNGEAR